MKFVCHKKCPCDAVLACCTNCPGRIVWQRKLYWPDIFQQYLPKFARYFEGFHTWTRLGLGSDFFHLLNLSLFMSTQILDKVWKPSFSCSLHICRVRILPGKNLFFPGQWENPGKRVFFPGIFLGFIRVKPRCFSQVKPSPRSLTMACRCEQLTAPG